MVIGCGKLENFVPFFNAHEDVMVTLTLNMKVFPVSLPGNVMLPDYDSVE